MRCGSCALALGSETHRSVMRSAELNRNDTAYMCLVSTITAFTEQAALVGCCSIRPQDGNCSVPPEICEVLPITQDEPPQPRPQQQLCSWCRVRMPLRSRCLPPCLPAAADAPALPSPVPTKTRYEVSRPRPRALHTCCNEHLCNKAAGGSHSDYVDISVQGSLDGSFAGETTCDGTRAVNRAMSCGEAKPPVDAMR